MLVWVFLASSWPKHVCVVTCHIIWNDHPCVRLYFFARGPLLLQCTHCVPLLTYQAKGLRGTRGAKGWWASSWAHQKSVSPCRHCCQRSWAVGLWLDDELQTHPHSRKLSTANEDSINFPSLLFVNKVRIATINYWQNYPVISDKWWNNHQKINELTKLKEKKFDLVGTAFVRQKWQWKIRRSKQPFIN